MKKALILLIFWESLNVKNIQETSKEAALNFLILAILFLFM